MKLWLTRQHNGLYMLTALPPVWCTVEGTDHEDAYVAAGEPVGLRNICPLILQVFGLRPFARGDYPVQVEITGRAL